MGKRDNKAFIVEGAKREPKIINSLEKAYFEDSNVKIFKLPAGQNIYMLWKQLEEDNFETDIIEVLRESNKNSKKELEGLGRDDFSEVFLFFDYDGQQNNLKEGEDPESVISRMLWRFDNETENGKLYISYPMVEALRDYTPDVCGNEEECFWAVGSDSGKGYKEVSANRSPKPHFEKFSLSDWKDVMNVFVMRVSCLIGEEEDIISYELYEEVSPEAIFAAQKRRIHEGKVFILSAFPEFLLDYFPQSFWNSSIVHTKLMRSKK